MLLSKDEIDEYVRYSFTKTYFTIKITQVTYYNITIFLILTIGFIIFVFCI